MEKQAIDFKEKAVAETLIIPLLARAKETKSENFILSDPKALDIVSQLNADSKRFEGGEISDFGILVRTEIIDCEIKKIIDNTFKSTVIINLGVGLDTRISRMDDKRLIWFDLDFPEVIHLRKKFFSEAENVSFIPKSVLDESWMGEIATGDDANVIFIAEGLLMYFPEPDVKKILGGISEKFKGAHMFFDVVHSYFVGKGISCQFLWGLDKASEIVKRSENIELIQSWSTGNLHRERQSLMFRILNIFPSTRNRSQILHIRFK